MAATTPDNIGYITTADTVTPATESAAQATSIQAAFSVRQVKTFKAANAAGVVAITGMAEGDIADQADTDLQYRYTGTVWRAYGYSGLIPIIPTSVSGTGVSVSSNGVITMSGVPGCTAATINGVFNSLYGNYLITYDITASGSITDGTIRLTSSGTPTAASGYGVQWHTSSGTTGADNFSLIGLPLSFGTMPRWTGKYDILGPAKAAAKGANGAGSSWTAGSVAAGWFAGGYINYVTPYDGLILTSSGAAATVLAGTIQIFGYNGT